MLKIENVNYKYNKNFEANNISNINITVKKRECVLLCGRSGSGKTTITKLMNSLIPNYYEEGCLEGRVLLNKTDTQKSEIYEVSKIVSSVFQNPKTQFFNVNTTSEILFYLENRGFDRDYMQKQLDETAKLLDIKYLLDRDIFQLSGGEKQIIAIAAACASGAEIILLDEPSSNLDEAKTKAIGEILKKLKNIGKTIIISEHRFYYIKDIIDKVYFIESGKIKNSFTKDEFFNIDNETRKQLGLRSILFENLKYKTSNNNKNKQLVIENINHKFNNQNRALKINNKGFEFGSIVGIYGKNGIGKSTLVKIIMGLQKSKKVKISIDGKTLSKRKRLKNSYLVMQDVNHQLFTESVKTEAGLGMAKKYTEENLNNVLKKLNIYDLKENHPMSLSGGQKQRVAIASAILSGANLIFFDEPTSGMDYDNMMKISGLIKETINDNIIIFIISHDHEFLNNTVDEIFPIENFSI
ncbi:MAG: ABC transporter ATP-binding protein [Treponema sp.]|nr:MAG: ABC transporter ATP-binding protein [Treponema sp.]